MQRIVNPFKDPYPLYSEKAVAPHSSTLAWKIPWTEEPGGLQSMGSLKVGHDWVTSLSLFTFMHWRRKWQPTPVFLPGESQGQGEPGGLLSLGSHRVRHNWSDLATAAAAATLCINKWMPVVTAPASRQASCWPSLSASSSPLLSSSHRKLCTCSFNHC